MQKKFLTTDEISEFYGIDADVVNELVDAGELKALPDRGTMKYRSDDVAALIKSGRLHPTKELPELGEDAVDSDLDFPVEPSGGEKADFLELDEDALAADSGAGLSPADSPPPAVSSDEVVVLGPVVGKGSDSDIHLRDQPFAPADHDASTLAEMDIEDGSDHVLTEFDEEGITLAPDDSGITLETHDSGITLADDSGLTIEGESGITLGTGKASHTAATEELDATVDMPFRFTDEDEPPKAVLSPTTAEDETPGLFDEGDDATAVVGLDSEDVSAATADDVDEISEELEEAVFDDEDASAEEEVIEASDEVFGEAGETEESEEYLEAAPGKPKVVVPSWGGLVNFSVLAASVVIALNAWLVFEGLSTMWSGADTSGPAQAIVQAIGTLGS
jgi:hypothetical protein